MTSEEETKLITDEEKKMVLCIVLGMIIMWLAGFMWGGML